MSFHREATLVTWYFGFSSEYKSRNSSTTRSTSSSESGPPENELQAIGKIQRLWDLWHPLTSLLLQGNPVTRVTFLSDEVPTSPFFSTWVITCWRHREQLYNLIELLLANTCLCYGESRLSYSYLYQLPIVFFSLSTLEVGFPPSAEWIVGWTLFIEICIKGKIFSNRCTRPTALPNQEIH